MAGAELPTGLDQLFLVSTADPHRVISMIIPAVVEWLQGQSGMSDLRPLTVEAGIAYSVAAGPIDPKVVLQAVDAILGLLERVPGVQPRSPAPTG